MFAKEPKPVFLLEMERVWHGMALLPVAVEEIHRCWLGDPRLKGKVSLSKEKSVSMLAHEFPL